MFKNAIIYRIDSRWTPDLKALERSLSKARFVRCSPSQAQSSGFVEPRGDAHAPLVESVGGQWIMRLCVETKKVPASAVQLMLQERLQQIERSTGRKPGKKESKELKEEILLELLPHAFPTQATIGIWLDPEARLLVVDAGSQGKADKVATALVSAADGFALSLVQTAETPASCMAHWLRTDEEPSNFSVDRECELKATDESRAVVRYGRHPLDIAEIKGHLQAGKVPTRLAMTWDSRVSLVLTDAFQLKKLTFLDTVFEGSASKQDEGFDADVAIMTGEMQSVIKDMIDAVGGEATHGMQSDDDGEAAASREEAASAPF